jgi:hypothetical protein
VKKTHLTAGEIACQSLLFSMIMGFSGWVLSVVRAALMNIVDARWAT